MNKHFVIAPGTNFEICVKQKLYGHRRNYLKVMQPGDRVVYYVDGKFAAVGSVTGKPFLDDKTAVWPDDLYPFRVQVTPEIVLPKSDWVPVDAQVKEKLVAHIGKRWIFYFRDVHAVPPVLATYLEELVKGRAGSASQSLQTNDFKDLQKEAKKQVQKQKTGTKPKEQLEILGSTDLQQLATPAEAQSHDRTQWYLIKLGRALGCEVWVAKNDRSKGYKGEAFSELCLKALPNLGFDRDTSQIIENIDVLWLKGNVIQCAFEVEHTTSVYSGLLRLADLVSSQPHITIKLFIVASKDRKAKVVFELNRPVFRVLLADTCKYISYDKLETTLAKIQDFQGYLQVGLVEKIAEPCSLKSKLL